MATGRTRMCSATRATAAEDPARIERAPLIKNGSFAADRVLVGGRGRRRRNGAPSAAGRRPIRAREATRPRARCATPCDAEPTSSRASRFRATRGTRAAEDVRAGVGRRVGATAASPGRGLDRRCERRHARGARDRRGRRDAPAPSPRLPPPSIGARDGAGADAVGRVRRAMSAPDLRASRTRSRARRTRPRTRRGGDDPPRRRLPAGASHDVGSMGLLGSRRRAVNSRARPASAGKRKPDRARAPSARNSVLAREPARRTRATADENRAPPALDARLAAARAMARSSAPCRPRRRVGRPLADERTSSKAPRLRRVRETRSSREPSVPRRSRRRGRRPRGGQLTR